MGPENDKTQEII